MSIQSGIHDGLRRLSRACAACLLAVALCGCVTDRQPPRGASPSSIDELNLLGLPVAVNLDGRPGADGVVVKLFATSRSGSRAMPLRSGTLELIAYEGTPSPAALPAPFHRWTFTPSELARIEFTTVLGTGYRLVLSWMPRLLPSDRVTVIARYHPHKGKPVTSAPSSITASAY